jgi:hypothetical protein
VKVKEKAIREEKSKKGKRKGGKGVDRRRKMREKKGVGEGKIKKGSGRLQNKVKEKGQEKRRGR